MDLGVIVLLLSIFLEILAIMIVRMMDEVEVLAMGFIYF
jgi:hypothetical protein